MTLKIECPLCGKDFGEVESADSGTTHRMCYDCLLGYRERAAEVVEEMDDEEKIRETLRRAFEIEEGEK